MVGATGFEPATTCTPKLEGAFVPVFTDSQSPQVFAIVEDGRSKIAHSFALNSPDPQSFTTRLLPDFERLILSPGAMMTVREVAAELRVCRATVYKLVARGALGAIRIVNSIRVARTEVDRFRANARCSAPMGRLT